MEGSMDCPCAVVVQFSKLSLGELEWRTNGHEYIGQSNMSGIVN